MNPFENCKNVEECEMVLNALNKEVMRNEVVYRILYKSRRKANENESKSLWQLIKNWIKYE